MSDSSNFKGKYLGFILTGIISLVVAVGGGYILNYLTEKRTALEYEVVNSEVFSGQKQNIAISTIDIRNSGKKELENLFCKIAFSNVIINEYKITGIPKSQSSTTQETNQFQLNAPFINPGEKVSVQFLLLLPAGQYEKPTIEVRGKGVVGIETTGHNRSAASPKSSLLLLLVTALLALSPMMLLILLKLNQKVFYTKKHADDQRDILAYVFAINGFLNESNVIRNLSRKVSYWAEADYLTEQCISTKDDATIRRGMKCLEDLIGYAEIAATSVLILNYNIARMAAVISDTAKANESLKKALEGNHKVIIKRIHLDNNLSELYKSVLEA